jgi:hypothetical protein
VEFQQGEGIESASTATSDHRVDASRGSPASPERSLGVEFQPGEGEILESVLASRPNLATDPDALVDEALARWKLSAAKK